MSKPVEITALAPTPLLRRAGASVRQIARISVRHAGAAGAATVSILARGQEVVTPVTLPSGESTFDVELAEVTAPCEVTAVLLLDGKPAACLTTPWQPPKRWDVHVVQLSHHDVGYTDLASHVLEEHDRWLDAVIDMAEATRTFPVEARFRLVIEQAWSIDHYLRHAPPARAIAMQELLRGGDVELTALFGNITTELCGHETLARSVYHAFRLKRDYGIPIVSAEHNDIPGFSWGLSEVLTAAGIRIFCPGLPHYYNWGYPDATTFWDEQAIFGTAKMPGAFWWEAPSGKRILFWCNNTGCGGDSHPELPGLTERLQQLADAGYPYPVLRWPVQGGARDNSPYIDGYARTIRAWNERWISPRLISSTNADFYRQLLPCLPADLPVWRGELPGQDYPVGASSTAAATAVNRRGHVEVPVAETLGTVASSLADYHYQHARLFAAYEEMLWHDEHTWGHHFPCGPTAAAGELEKAVHAYRAATLAHDVANKAMARVADAVCLEVPDIHLVVFNPLPEECSGTVSIPLREIDNCGSEMIADDGRLRGKLLQDRWHVNPPEQIVNGHFDLIDVATGAEVPYQIVPIDSPLGPAPYASQRLGIGAGSKRYSVFETPAGLARDLCFTAVDVPAVGYRTYRLRPRETRPVFPAKVTAAGTVLENAWYRLEIDVATGFVISLLDKETGRELVQPAAAHPFGALLVRDPYGQESLSTCVSIEPGEDGACCAVLRVRHTAPGHPQIETTYSLTDGEKRLDIAVHLLKDPTPLLEAYLAFPFHLPEKLYGKDLSRDGAAIDATGKAEFRRVYEDIHDRNSNAGRRGESKPARTKTSRTVSAGRFRYEGPCCVVDPAVDLLPGAFADRLAVQNWVAVSDDDYSVLWCSREAPVVSLARLWPGRVSPAHSAVVRADLEHPRPTAEELRGGTIYSLLTANNFGTNFAVSQSGNLLFRYSLTSQAGTMDDADAARRGQQWLAGLPGIFTRHDRPRTLPPSGSFLAIDNPAVRLLTLKHAEDGRGLVLRLWNPSAEHIAMRIALLHLTPAAASLLTLAEEDTGEALPVAEHQVAVSLPARSVVTVRVEEKQEKKA